MEREALHAIVAWFAVSPIEEDAHTNEEEGDFWGNHYQSGTGYVMVRMVTAKLLLSIGCPEMLLLLLLMIMSR